MTDAIEAKKNIQFRLEELNEERKHLAYIDHLLAYSKWLTFGLYLMFALSLYVGNVFHIEATLTKYAGSEVGLGAYLIICVLLAYQLSGTKHAAYTHFSMFKTTFGIVAVVICMGLLAEWITSADMQDTKARVTTENNAEYQNLVGSSSTNSPASISVDPLLAAQIATAQKVYNRCQERLAIGKEPHCNGDKGELDSLQATQRASIEASTTAATAIATASREADRDRIDNLKEESYNLVFRMLKDVMGWTIATAVSALLLLVAIFFEIGHYKLSSMRRETREAIRGLQRELAAHEIDYERATGEEFDTGQPQPMANPMPAAATAFHGTGIPSPLAKLADKAYSAFGGRTAPAPTEKQLTQAERNANSEKWRNALEDRGVPVPDIDKAMEQDASDETIENILGKIKPEQGNKFLTDFLLDTVRRMVIDGECLPSVRPVTNAITALLDDNAEKYGVKRSLFDKPLRVKMAETILMKLELEGTIQRKVDREIGENKYEVSARYRAPSSRPEPHSDARPVDSGEASQSHPKAPETAAEMVANPGNFKELKMYLNNQKFSEIFISVATGHTTPSQNQVKKFGVGGDLPKWLLIIMEAAEIVSAPATNKQRTLINKLSETEAKQTLAEVRAEILGDEA